MGNILIVEDDASLRKGIIFSLSENDVIFHECGTIEEAKQVLSNHMFDLILLDVNLPDGNGFDLCQIIRCESTVPIILLTARDLEIDIVTGLGLGADDYVTKPFSLSILRARVSAVLRRKAMNQQEATIYRYGETLFDFDELYFVLENQQLALTKSEIKLLKVFCAHPNQTLLRERLEEIIWSVDADFVDANALSVTIKRLRDKLAPNEKIAIKTVYGLGYRWEVSL